VNSILSAATLAIAALPEEFPVVFTFYLGLGVYRLAKKHALVRKAVSVENIGRVGHILTDKTGTLTFGHLKLAHVISRDNLQNDLIISALTSSQSNNSDPLNQGIFEYAKNDVSSKKTASKVFPFTEDRKKESVIDSEGTCHSKGAPEVIINQCELNPMERSFWLDKVNHLSKEGHKVIACSRRLNLVTQEVEPEEGYHFLGLLAFEDSPRPEVKEAMSFCLSNQIKVTMITGDHLETAKALANEIGLSESELKCISAEDNFEKFTSEWVMNNPGYFKSFHVIARCRPSQKALVVQSLKNDQTVIAVTGDGINDVPALKSADISIAMGKRGDQSAKEISHIILMDDNFSSIVNAIKEGKILYSNLKRSFHYLILIHIPFVLSAAIIPFFHFTVLYYPSLVVWIELLIHPSAILGFSQGRLGNSSLRSTHFFDKSELWEIIGLSSVVLIFMLARFFLSLSQAGDEDYARSVVFSILLIWNSVVLFHLGDLKSKILIIVILSTFLPSLFLLQFGPLSALFHLTPLSSWDWGISALFLLTLIGIVRFKKVIFS
jgi:Ca2+-transporting ATPase